MIAKTLDALRTEWTRIHTDVLPAASLRGRLARGTFWTLASTAFVQASGLLASIATARILGTAGFGELGMVRSTVLLFGVLAGTGLGMAATKHVAEHRDGDPQRAGRFIGLLLNVALLLGGAATVLCLALAGPLARWAMNAEQLGGALRLGCLLLGLNVVGGVQVGAINGFEAFRTTARVSLADAALNLALIPAGAWAFGVPGAVAGSVVAAAAGFPVKHIALGRVCRRAGVAIVRRGAWSEHPALWSFALPSVLLGLAIQPFEWAARLFLVRQPNGFSELGMFTAAWSLAQLVTFLPGQVAAPSMPIMVTLHAARDSRSVSRVMTAAFLAATALGLVSALPLVLFSRAVMSSFGDGFASGGAVLALVTAAYVVGAGTMVFRSAIAASGRMWWQVAHTAVWGALLAGAAFLFRADGARGLAIAYLVAYGGFWLVQGAFVILIFQRPGAGRAKER